MKKLRRIILVISIAFLGAFASPCEAQLASGPNIVRMDDGSVFGIYVHESFLGFKTFTIHCPTVKTDRKGKYIEWKQYPGGAIVDAGSTAAAPQFGALTSAGSSLFGITGLNWVGATGGNGTVSHGGGGLKPSEINPKKACPPVF